MTRNRSTLSVCVRASCRIRGGELGFGGSAFRIKQFHELDCGVATRVAVARTIGVVEEFCGVGQSVAVRDAGILWAFADFGRERLGQSFEGLVGFVANAIGIVVAAEGFGSVVAGLLEGFKLAGDAIEHGDAAFVLLWVGGQELLGFGLEKEPGQLGGGDLKTDFGKLGGVVAAEKINKAVLVKAELGGVFLCEAPFAVATLSFPVGDVLLVNGNAEFVEGGDDFVLGNVLKEHAIDDIANGFWEASDLADAGPASGRRMSGRMDKWIIGQIDAWTWRLWRGSWNEGGVGWVGRVIEGVQVCWR